MPSVNDVTTVFITVLSSKNTHPVFNNVQPQIIPSDAISETVIFTLSATDEDYPEFGNGEILYDITNEISELDETTLFSVVPSTGDILLLLSPLEIALLTGYPASSIKVSVDVLVYDLSIVPGFDNATVEFRIQLPNPGPNITHVPAYFELQEEQDGDYLFTVTAVDENPPLLYTLDGSGSKHFSIDVDGNVFSNRKFDSEKGDIGFEIVVIVTDQSGLKDYAVVPVTILDINDNLPKFTESFRFEVREDAKIQTRIGQVYATDEDIGLTNFTNRVKYKLLENSLYFEINGDTGEIETKDQLDREIIDSFNITVVASNDMPYYLNMTSDTKTDVSIIIIDVNDNAPKFDKESYETFFTNFVEGAEILTIHAEDRDQGYNGMVVYSLSAVDSSLEFFTINKTTGVITNIKELSLEMVNELPEVFSMVAYAFDQGSPPQSDEVVVDIIVAQPDLPAFKAPQEQTLLEVEEGSTSEVIPFPPATLSDEYMLEGNVTYTITGGTGLGYFCIPEPLVNALKPIKALNREDNANYTLVISAGFCNNTQDQCKYLTSDCKTERRAEIKQATTFEKRNILWHNPSDTVLNQNEILLTILIEDVNDEAPTIEGDRTLNISGYSAGVRDDAEYGYEIFQVQANDEDLTSELQFAMSSINTDANSLFEIDPVTGQVIATGFLYKKIDYCDPQESWKEQEYQYIITVNDTNGHINASTDANATIKILSRFEHILLIFNKQAEDLKQQQNTIVQKLEEKYDMKIVIESLSPRTEYFPFELDYERSEMMIYALAKYDGSVFTYEDFKDHTSCDEGNMDGVDNCSMVPIKKIYSTQNDTFGLVLIIFASLIFVGSCILIYLVIYSFGEYEQSRRNNVLRESRMENHTNAAYNNDEVNDIYKIPLLELSSSTIDEVGQETADNTENDELPINNIYESMEDVSELMNDGNDKVSDGFDPYNIDWDSAIVPKTPNGTRKTTVARVYVDSSKLVRHKASNDADSGILINEEDKSNDDKSANQDDKPDADQEDTGLGSVGSEEYEEPLVIAPGTIEGGTEDTLVEEDHEVFKKTPEKTETIDHTCIDINGTSDDGGDKASTDFTSISMTKTGEEENPNEHVDNKKVRFKGDVILDDIPDSEGITAL
ncbi:protocadherin Fat 4-like [Anneissia japonica]|uniref:protocadherin Fat 4-like n=1 Tax=Anneissia japonica TaxID=1529436 RepID=UPI0014259F83|nr:protocadherin Fat 4-like [Anneissia japonica]